MIVFNFHGVGPLVREIGAGEHDCWLDMDHFEAILDRIAGDERVLITFDDGNSSDYEVALPALLKRKLKACFFVCSGRLGDSTFLNVAQLRELSQAGMKIGSHGVDHLPWRNLGDRELRNELRASRENLQAACGVPVDMVACPFGGYDRRVLKEIKSAGYRVVFTSDGGPCSAGSWLQARNTLKRSTSLEQLDWLLGRGMRPAWHLANGLRTTLKRLRPATSPARRSVD